MASSIKDFSPCSERWSHNGKDRWLHSGHEAHQVADVIVALQHLVGVPEAVGIPQVVRVSRGLVHPGSCPGQVVPEGGRVVPVHHAAPEGHVRQLAGRHDGVAQDSCGVLHDRCQSLSTPKALLNKCFCSTVMAIVNSASLAQV